MREFEKKYKYEILSMYSNIYFPALDMTFSFNKVFFPIRLSEPQDDKHSIYEKNNIRTVSNPYELKNKNNDLLLDIIGLLDCRLDEISITNEIIDIQSNEWKNKTIREQNYIEDLKKDKYSIEDYILSQVDSILNNNVTKRTIIVGKSGSGKTTYIRRLALAYALEEKEYIKACNGNIKMFPVFIQCEMLLGIIKDNPFFIHLAEKDFVEFLYRSSCCLFKNLQNYIQLWEFKDFLASKIKDGSLYVIIDSYDEFSDELRLIFTNGLKKFLVYNERVNLIICSHKDIFYLNRLNGGRSVSVLTSIPGIKFQKMIDLSDTEITDFIRNWMIATSEYETKPDIDKAIKSLFITKSTYFDSIKRNPFYLSILLCIYRKKGEIPRKKDIVLSQFIQLSLGVGVSESNNYKKFLSFLAYTMSLDLVGVIEEKELKKILLKCYSNFERTFLPEIPKDDIDGYINDLLNHCEKKGVLKVGGTIDGERHYAFEHLLFQEYFSAYAINYLYCPNITRFTKKVDVIKDSFSYLNYQAWREIILMVVLMEKDRPRNEYVKILLDFSNRSNNAYYSYEILFDIVLYKYIDSSSLIYEIYDSLFGSFLTNVQLLDMCDRINDCSLPDDFLTYTRERFEISTLSNKLSFQYINTIIQIENCINEGVDPFQYAVTLLEKRNDYERILGLYMMAMMSWAHYNKVDVNFSDIQCMIDGNIIDLILDCIDSNNYLLVESACKTIRSMVYAEYLYDDGNYWHAIIKKCVSKISNITLYKYIIRVISVIPISYYSIVELNYPLRNLFWENIDNKFDEDYKKGDILLYINSFVECVLKHRWLYSDNSLINAFRKIQLETYSNDELDEGSKIRIRQIDRQISLLIDPISYGIEEYKENRYDNAKNAFIFAFMERIQLNTAKTFLAFMLRRNELDSVVIDGVEYGVKDLLDYGIDILSPITIMNRALLFSYVDNMFDYKVGIAYLKNFLEKTKLFDAFSWWSYLAKRGDLEGYVVLLWLLDLGAIDEDMIDIDRNNIIKKLEGTIINMD